MNGLLGTVGESPDGLFALVCSATAVNDSFALERAYTIQSMDSLTALGITAANNARLYKHISDFYTEAENGTKLVIFGVDKAKTMTELCDRQTGAVKKLVVSQNGALRGIFVARDNTTKAAATDGLEADVFTALAKAQQMAEWSTTDLYAPLFFILEGRGYTGTTLKDLSNETYNRVGVLLGDTEVDSQGACVGTLAGRLASLPVQRNIGRVKNGALKTTLLYVGKKKVEEDSEVISSIHDKGYITARKYVGRSGYFFADDRLACVETDDYAHLSNRRVIDKAYRIAYNTLLDMMLDELEINSDGTMQTGVITSWQQTVENAINRSMTAAGELSASNNGEGCSCYIDPKQNVVATSKVEMTLKVRPFGYARYVDVNLGFQVTTV